jgi:phenylpropionate dioxygenase-like ring-hydroxylating dioxygenase large terminal subunit
MGDLLRLYWMPFLPSTDLVAGRRPTRIRLLGEDLIAFRSPDGEVRVQGAACPHRQAPLAFARNEEGGLRCIYHAWKFNAEGVCIGMPNEARARKHPELVRVPSYPCRERNGIVWVHMGNDRGDASELPDLPALEWNMVPEDQVYVSLRVQRCNWVQALEGEIDSSHAPILHGQVDGGGLRSQTAWDHDLDPRLEVADADHGTIVAACRDADDKHYWRINQFLMPFWTLVPPTSPFPNLSGHAWIPMDDTTTLTFMFSYQPTEPLPEKVVKLFREGARGRESGHLSDRAHLTGPAVTVLPFGKYWPTLNPDNDYGYDEALEATHFSALPGLWVQDAACQEAIAPIMDRSKENLGASDIGIIRMRRMLLKAARALRDSGTKPVSAQSPEVYAVRAASPTLERDADWREAAGGFCKAGGDYGYDIL